MKGRQNETGLLLVLALTVMVAEANAGGVPEEMPEPTVRALRTVPLACPVVPTVRPRVHCVFVPVATHVEPAETYVNQGLSVANCCCGVITIAGSSVTLGGQTSVQQEMRCDAGGDQ